MCLLGGAALMKDRPADNAMRCPCRFLLQSTIRCLLFLELLRHKLFYNMTDNDERPRYRPMRRGPAHTEPAQRLPFDISSLSVTGLIIICGLDNPTPGNSRPSMNMKITQCLRLSDESMIRLDMDRGVSAFKLGHTKEVSWKRAAADVISEVLTLVKADATEADSFPWEQYAQAARLRGISVDAEVLRDLPRTVLLSNELATISEW